MKKQILLLGLLASGLAYSQIGRVGVNTDSPRATFEVTPTTANADATATTNEGILIPRVSKDRLANIATANLVDGTMVFVDNVTYTGTNAIVSEVNEKGFYYYNSTKSRWVAVGKEQDLRMVGTNNHITQDAGVGGNGTSVGTGTANIGIGSRVLYNNTTGRENVAIGHNSSESNTTGSNNVAIGRRTLFRNTTGSRNTALGSGALSGNSTGNENVAVGSGALQSNISGKGNVAVGVIALGSNMTGSNNIGIGNKALYLSKEGNNNTAIGESALYYNTTGNYNLAIGYYSLNRNTTGSYNLGIGYRTLLSNTIGNNNIALGNNTLNSNTEGGGNIGLGNSVLLSNTTGSNNVGMGLNSLRNNTTGLNNVGTGVRTLFSNTTGSQNMAYGTETLYRNTTGQYNVGFGYRAIYNNVGGDSNVALGGNQSGAWIKGNSNVHIGNGLFQSASTAELDNVIAIGNGLSSTELTATTGQDNTIILGYKNGHNFSPKVGIGTYKPDSKVHIVANGPNAIKIEDTTQAEGKVLTSDANGVGSWKYPTVNIITGVYTTQGIDIPYNQTDWKYTGAYIAVPPSSKYMVTVTALMSFGGRSAPATGHVWLRTRFADSPTATTASPHSGGGMGKTLISGSISAGDYYNIMTGSVILENPDPVSYKLFYYQAGDVNANGTTQTLLRFGGKYWGEGSIVGIPIL